ncbi:MAG TPA: hypothetical protein DCY31_08200 [Ruminococcaceae bacterium]|nr:hypothetical protein [Oscillospiraceae bacterium]
MCKNFVGLLTQVKKLLCNMAENIQARRAPQLWGIAFNLLSKEIPNDVNNSEILKNLYEELNDCVGKESCCSAEIDKTVCLRLGCAVIFKCERLSVNYSALAYDFGSDI